MHNFKAGDRVVYKIGKSTEDHGVVTRTEKYHIWCKWDSDYRISYATVENLTPERTDKMNTTTLQDLEAKYTELRAEIQKLKEAKEVGPQYCDNYQHPIKDEAFWEAVCRVAKEVKAWPQRGDTYWAIYNDVEIESVCWLNDHVDRSRKAIGNIFRTQEEAEKQLEALKVVAELRSQPGRKKFVVGEGNWGIEINLVRGMPPKCILIYTYETGWQSVYFDSKESVQAAINAVGVYRILAASKWFSQGE